jgi:hypothetical protein
VAEETTQIEPFSEGASSVVLYGEAPPSLLDETGHIPSKMEDESSFDGTSSYEIDILFGTDLGGLKHDMDIRGRAGEINEDISDIRDLY